MKYKNIVYCDICGRPMIMPTGRIEWCKDENEIHICHHECSWARNDSCKIISDMELDGPIYTEALVYARLCEVAQTYPDLAYDCKQIIDMTFEQE